LIEHRLDEPTRRDDKDEPERGPERGLPDEHPSKEVHRGAFSQVGGIATLIA
jgi:hypothetical protein